MGRRFGVLDRQTVAAGNIPAVYDVESSEEHKRSALEWMRGKVAATVGTVAAASVIFGSTACGSEAPEREATPAAAGSVTPGETVAPAPVYNEQNVPLEYKGKEYTGTAAFEKANELLVEDCPTPRGAIKCLVGRLDAWSNWTSDPTVNSKYPGYQSQISPYTGADGIMEDFVSPAMVQALTGEYSETPDGEPYPQTNLTDYINSLAHKVSANHEQSAEKGGSYELSFGFDESQPDGGIHLVFNEDNIYAFQIYLTKHDNAVKAGLPESLSGKDQWMIVLEKQKNADGQPVWKEVESLLREKNYDTPS